MSAHSWLTLATLLLFVVGFYLVRESVEVSRSDPQASIFYVFIAVLVILLAELLLVFKVL